MSESVICGNGETIVNRPNGYDTFGVNFCHLCGLWPDYYVCIDRFAILEHASKLAIVAGLAKVAYLSPFFTTKPEAAPLYSLPNVEIVNKNQREFKAEAGMSGFTGVYVALKQAYYLGYETVYLYGVDHDPEWKHASPYYPPSNGSDYLRARMREHFRIAADVYKAAGRRIINRSKPSELDRIFER